MFSHIFLLRRWCAFPTVGEHFVSDRWWTLGGHGVLFTFLEYISHNFYTFSQPLMYTFQPWCEFTTLLVYFPAFLYSPPLVYTFNPCSNVVDLECRELSLIRPQENVITLGLPTDFNFCNLHGKLCIVGKVLKIVPTVFVKLETGRCSEKLGEFSFLHNVGIAWAFVEKLLSTYLTKLIVVGASRNSSTKFDINKKLAPKTKHDRNLITLERSDNDVTLAVYISDLIWFTRYLALWRRVWNLTSWLMTFHLYPKVQLQNLEQKLSAIILNFLRKFE